MRFQKLLSVVVLTALPLICWSDNYRFEITPYGAFTAGGKFTSSEDENVSVKIEDSGSFGLILNMREGANTQWELLYSLQGTEASTKGLTGGDIDLDLDVHYLHIGGTYQGDGEHARPYLAAGIGATHFNVKTEGFGSDTFFSFSVGPGVQLMPHSRIGIRLEARAYGTLVQSDTALFCVSDPGGGTAGCAIAVSGAVLWQFQASLGVIFRF